MRARRKPGGHMCRKRRECRITHQEDIEVFGKIFVSGASSRVAHVRGIAGQQNVPDALRLKEIPQLGIALGIVDYDAEGYPKLRDFLKTQGIRHVLLTGYATDMCYARTCAGYENLSKDFNVFLVGDATLSTFPAHVTPRFATSAHIAFASLNQLVTQVSWIKYERK